MPLQDRPIAEQKANILPPDLVQAISGEDQSTHPAVDWWNNLSPADREHAALQSGINPVAVHDDYHDLPDIQKAQLRTYFGGQHDATETGGHMLNIGLSTQDGGSISPQVAIRELTKLGVGVNDVSVKQSPTEPTLIASLERPLDPNEAHDLSATLRQGSIAQYTKKGGELYGPDASQWRPFNPDLFLTHSGKSLSEERADQWGDFYNHLTTSEKNSVRDNNISKIRDQFEQLPTKEHGADIAIKRPSHENLVSGFRSSPI